jgi:aryl-alcohol dehydrogenase-like predicted oxidoreductase
MRYKLLGPSGLRVSEICLGTMSFGDAWGFGADERESHCILAAYGEAGGNFIDTANKYHEGQSEAIVGTFLGSERDRWVLASKYTLAMRDGDPNAAGNSRKNMRQSVEASLRRLRTDYLDLLFVHAWDYATPVEEVMRGLDDLVRAGKVNYVALSDAPAWIAAQANTLAALRGWNPFVALQLEYSLIERTGERELLPVADAFGLSVTAWAPMGGGLLTGKYTRRPSKHPEDTRRAAGNAPRLTERNLEVARAGRARQNFRAGGRSLGTAARGAGHPDRRRPHARPAPRRPRQPRPEAVGRPALAPRRRERDRARVPVQPPRRPRGPAGLRRPRAWD